jgi:hypothetical protein
LRRAREAIEAGDATPPTVLRETVREVVPPEASSRDWLMLLGVLAEQLEDSTTALTREHWQHVKIFAALRRVAAALDAAHPGGLGRVR